MIKLQKETEAAILAWIRCKMEIIGLTGKRLSGDLMQSGRRNNLRRNRKTHNFNSYT